MKLVNYTKKWYQLNVKYLERFWDVLEHEFIASLDNKRKINLVKIYLETNKSIITYTKAKQIINKIYQPFGKSSPLNRLYKSSFSLFFTPIQSNWLFFYKLLKFYNLYYLKTILNTNQIIQVPILKIKLAIRFFIQTFIAIIAKRKITTL